MPIHDWTKVSPGTWHDFHFVWIAEIRNRLNLNLLPSDYYAQAEQIVGPFGPDVLTLRLEDGATPGDPSPSEGGLAIATAVAPPRARIIDETDEYALKRRTIVIRHVSGDRVVALIELMSPGNKSSRKAFDSFLKKALESLERGYHLLILDLFPPTSRDPQGIHGAIWTEFGRPYSAPADEPLTLAAYSAGHSVRCYVEPTAVGRELIDMPLFLEPETYVNVPLEETYRNAYGLMHERWKRVIEGRR